MTDALLTVLELAGIFTFAVTGALVGVRHGFDVFGVTVLALITGLGGGVLRDVLIGDVPPLALREWQPFAVAVVAALLVSTWHARIGRRERTILFFDALGLGLFCVTGAVIASEAGLGTWSAAVLGVLTGIGGGVMRDVLAQRSPVIFGGELYATPAALGALVASITWHQDGPGWLYVVASVACIVWRLLSVRHGWSAPHPLRRDEPDHP